jgi:hypothetical protein
MRKRRDRATCSHARPTPSGKRLKCSSFSQLWSGSLGGSRQASPKNRGPPYTRPARLREARKALIYIQQKCAASGVEDVETDPHVNGQRAGHRSALEDHVHRAPRLGERGLLNVRIGMKRLLKQKILISAAPKATLSEIEAQINDEFFLGHFSFLRTASCRRRGARFVL